MTAEAFFEKFDELADAPDAVSRMREIVLDMGAMGRLIPTEGSWPTRLLKTLATKIGSGATPNGGRESYFSEGIPLIRSMNVHFRAFDKTGLVFLNNEQARQLSNVIVQPGDVLLNITGASIGRVTVAPPEMAGARVNQHVTIIRPNVELCPDFLSIFLASPRVQRMINEVQVGATRQALTKGMIEQFEIRVPSIEEQKRIVAKVDELMALCDRLETQQQERETRQAELARAALARFADVPTSANLNFLFHKSYDIDPTDLRKSILTLAVQGKLIPQDPTDEPAMEFVARLALQKRQLVEKKVIKAEAPLEPIAVEEEPFTIPNSWIWQRAGDLCYPISSGSTPDQAEFHPSAGIPYLKVYNIRNQKVDFDYKRQFINAKHHRERMKRSSLIPGDVIMNIVGPPLGKVAIVPAQYPEWNCNQAISFFRPLVPDLAPYLYYFLREGSFLKDIQLIGTAGQDNISVTKCKSIPISVPPHAEQKRIVAKVGELMALVDQLEAQLTTSRAAGSQLLEAIVADLSA